MQTPPCPQPALWLSTVCLSLPGSRVLSAKPGGGSTINPTTTHRSQTHNVLWNRNGCKLPWNYGVPHHLLQYIYSLNSKKKKKFHFLSLILPNPNSLSCSLVTIVGFISILLGSSKLHFTVWKMFFEETRSTSGGEKYSQALSLIISQENV